MASPSEPTTVTDLLEAALAPVLGGAAQVGDLKRLSGGASRETWSFSTQARPMILRRDPPGRPGPAKAMRNEADVLRACARAGLSVPELILQSDAASPGGASLGTDGMVMTAVAGETIPRRILRDDAFANARSVLAGQVAEFMAGLHAIDPDEVPGASGVDDLANYRAAYKVFDDVSPAFERTFAWLEDNRPSSGRRTLVHGDLRMGNLIVDNSGLAAVIDWELLHVGDPVEDLAWFCVKAWRFGSPLGAGGVATVDQFISAYEAASGFSVDRDAFHWWLVEKTLTWGVIAMGQAHAHLSGSVRSHELAAVGRRVAEQEWDLVELLAPNSALSATSPDPGSNGPPTAEVQPRTASPAPLSEVGIFGRPTSSELLDAVRLFLSDELIPQLSGRQAYNTRVAANMIAIVERELAARAGDQPDYEFTVTRDASTVPLATWDSIAEVVLAKVKVTNPGYVEDR